MEASLDETLLSVGDLVRWGASRLNATGRHFGHGTDNAADEARVIVFHALSLDYDCPTYFYQCRVTPDERAAAIALIERRIATGLPAAYLTGEAWFAGLRFEVGPDVLVPRSPVAELIGNGFVDYLAPEQLRRALDLGTGSGCIAVALAVYLGCEVDATDISAAALEVARRNVHAHDQQDRVTLIRSDVFDSIGDRRYDLIITNPPYVSHATINELPDEYSHEPELALAAGEDGLDIVHRILAGAARHLEDDGILICEVGESALALQQAYPALPFEWVEFQNGGDGVFVLRAEALSEVGRSS